MSDHVFTLRLAQTPADWHEMVCSCGALAKSEDYVDVLQVWKKLHLKEVAEHEQREL